jgi:hypothetical protein
MMFQYLRINIVYCFLADNHNIVSLLFVFIEEIALLVIIIIINAPSIWINIPYWIIHRIYKGRPWLILLRQRIHLPPSPQRRIIPPRPIIIQPHPLLIIQLFPPPPA